MNPRRLHGQIQAELMHLVGQEVITFEQMEKIGERYPVTPWNLVSLVRWFTVLGAVAMFAGLVILSAELVDTEILAQLGTFGFGVFFLWLGRFLEKKKDLLRSGWALQLLGGLSLCGFFWVEAWLHSTGSGNWPAVVGVCTLMCAGLAYALKNPLLLIAACIQAFIWFGGSTGYMSGWGAYWLGMTYPVRFLIAGSFSLVVGLAHYQRWIPGPASFARVFFHHGALVLLITLWFLSLFGWYTERVSWDHNTAERLFFSAAWAGAACASLWVGSRYGLQLFRGYGLTFLILNAYTAYFQFLARHSPEVWWLHLLLIGGSMVAVGIGLEKRLRSRSVMSPPPPRPGASPERLSGPLAGRDCMVGASRSARSPHVRPGPRSHRRVPRQPPLGR